MTDFAFVPCRVFFTKGVGKHKENLAAFESALRSARIQQFNLVSVSSILPQNCKIIPRKRGIQLLKPGQVVFVVMSRNETNEPNRLVGASIGVAVPESSEKNYGYLSEHHSFGETERRAGDYAEDLAASMLASTMGVEFDPEKAYDERKQVYKMSKKIVRTMNITQTAFGDKAGLWTTVIAAAVFII